MVTVGRGASSPNVGGDLPTDTPIRSESYSECVRSCQCRLRNV